MAMDIGDIVAYLKLDMDDFANGMNQASKQLNNTATQVSNSTTSISGDVKALVMQNLGAIGQQIGSAGKQILDTYGAMINITSEYCAEVEQQEFVYKNLSKESQKAIDDNKKLADSLGMTEQQYLNNATSIASYLENAGVMPSVIAEQSEKITILTADMAAFANVPVDQAVSDFKSALMGNFEVLDKYGINLSVATINNSEYAKQLGKTWDKMDEAEKKQAILNEMYRQSADYTGLASQEAESFAMQLNLLKARITEAVAALGQQLLPVLEPLIATISDIITKMTEWIQKHPELTQFILVLVAVIGALMAVIGPLITLFGSLAAIAAVLGVSIGAVCWPILAVIAAIVALVAAGYLLWKNWDAIKAKAIEVWGSVKQWFQDFFHVTDEQMQQMGENWRLAWENICLMCEGFLQLLKGIFTLNLGDIKEGAGKIWDGLVEWIKLGWENLKLCFEIACNWIKDLFWNWVNGLSEDAQNLIKGWLENFQTAWEAIKQIFDGALKIIKGIWEGDWQQVSEGGKQIWEGIKQWFKAAWENLKMVAKAALEALKEWVKQKFEDMKAAVKEKMESLKENAKQKFEELKEAAKQKIEDMKNSVKEKIEDMKNQAKQKFTELKNQAIQAIQDLPNKARQKFEELKQAVVTKLTEATNQAKSKMEEMKNAIGNALTGLPGKLKQAARDAIQGLIDGLGEKLGQVKAKAQEIASAVSGAMKDFLKINSPSKLIRDEVGKSIPEGLAVGIDANADDAISSAEDLAKSLVIGPDMQGLRNTVNSTGYSNTMYSSNSSNQLMNTLNAILSVLTNNPEALGVNINIEEFNNNTNTDVNTLMQRMAAQIKLNNLGKGVR